MTTPPWRNWLKRNTHAVIFVMREFFAFMGNLRKGLLKHKTIRKIDNVLCSVFNKLDLRNKSKKFILVSLLALVIFAGVAIFFATTAKAEKEVHAYVTASYVSGEGFENIPAAQAQDLSVDARISDFTPDVSARVAFGTFAKTVDDSIKLDDKNNSSSTDDEMSSSTPDVKIETKPESASTTIESTSTVDKSVTFLNNIFVATKKVAAKLIGLKTVIAQESNSPAPADTPATPAPVDTPTTPASSDIPSAPAVTDLQKDNVTVTGGGSKDNVTPPSSEVVNLADTTPTPVTKEDRDPFKVSSCSTFGKTCHLISLEGFGVGPELSKYPVKDARLMLSLAGRALPSDHPDRIVVRSYTDGRWNYLGEQVVKGEFDNAMRGSYVSMPLSIDSWSDLADMIVSVEYVREGDTDSVTMVDSAWVDVAFAAEESPDDLALYSPNVKSALLARDAERRARERDHLELQNGLSVDFKNTMQGLVGSKLRVATTKEKISVFGNGEEYVAVTNFSNTAEKVHLSFYFPEEGGRVTDIAKYVHNSPYKVVESKSTPIAYFCEPGWIQSTSTDEVIQNKPYFCDGGSEPHVCSSISASGTSCLSEINSINKEESTVYRRFFEPDSIFAGSYGEKQSIVGKVIDSLFSDMPDNTIPASQKEVSYSNSFDLEPGATRYFRVGFNTPLNSRGDIYIKAESDGGSYGLAKTEFDGSWNYRMPIDIGLPYRVNNGEVAMPISLDKMPLSFWDHVNDTGSDIRFSDEDGLNELSSWVADFNKQTRKGFVWVRLPANAGVMPRVFLYAGNNDAAPLYNAWQTLTSSSLSDRAVVISNGVEDVDVQVTALAPLVRVSVADGEEKTLLYGETALFNGVKNSSIVRATGPISSRVSSVFGRATLAPLGMSAMNVGIPDGTLELGVVSGQGEKGNVTIGKTENELAERSVYRTPVVKINRASSSIPALFVADTDTDSYILSDTTLDERYKLSSSVVLDKKALAVRATCDSIRAYGAYDSKGSLLATTTCNSVLNGPFDEGTLVSVFYGPTSTQFSASFTALYNGDERIISGSDINSRNPAGFDPEIAFGEPEFVIPGEHRQFDSEFNKDKPHITRFLSKKREFSAEEDPIFRFQYKPQSSSFFRTLRSLVGLSPFKVEGVVVEQAGQPVNIKTTVEYTGSLEWTVKIDKSDVEKIAPGKLTLKMNIKEGVSTYEDSYDFYWGLLSINFNKSVYEKGESASIYLGALSETGNTICNAKLKLFVSNGTSTADEIPVSTSGQCDGNNVVDVPDYSASFTPVDTGTYNLRLIRLDEAENVLAEVRDSFNVVNHQSYIIERKGPTRINPTSPYDMTIRVVSREGYKGQLKERIPGDFEIINRGGSSLEWIDDDHTAKFAVWDIDLKPGETYQYTYSFDAPDVSPFIYFLGPATVGDGDTAFTEQRKWMIASDAVGRMIIYWSNNTTPPPAAQWDCISCGGLADNTLVNRWPMGSSTYARLGGAYSHQPTAIASVGPSSGQTANIGAGGTILVYKNHNHSIGVPTVTVSDHKPPSLSLKAYKHKNAGEQVIPAGSLLFFEEIPSGWTEYAAANGKYPYAAPTAGNATGTATHTHTITSTTGAPVGGGTYVSGTRTPGISRNTHTHVVPATTTVALVNEPPYVTYRMASANSAGSIPNGAIAMWDQDPAIGWLNLSIAGGVLENKFVKVMTSAGASGGSNTHTHADVLGARANTSATVSNYPTGASQPYGAASSHTHMVDYTSFSTVTSLPPYATVVFGKRSAGTIQYSQENYRFYDNVNDIQPIDPWPLGSEVDLGENLSIDDSSYRIKPGNNFRLRMNVFVGNATSSAGSNKLKLQYSTDGVCSSALNWSDVGAPGSSSPLRGYDNGLVSHGATLGTALLTSSTAASLQYYSELTNSLNMVRDGRLGTYAEFDWSLNASSELASSSRYCLRMVEDTGKVFNAYSKYPSFISNNAPNAPILKNYFDNAKINTLTPLLSFTTTDNEDNAMHYMIEVDDDPNFGSPLVSQSTFDDSSYFSNQTNPSNKVPYTGGDMVQYEIQSGALQNNTTYWWRVRAMDPNGSTQYGDWSIMRSFTTDTALANSAWYQTTAGQFGKNTLTGLIVSGNSVVLDGGSEGTIYSQPMTFSDGANGTVWGELRFNDDGGGNISYQVEYRDKYGGWNLIPDGVLSSNSTGFTSSPKSLTTVDPLYYPTIRLKGTFDNSWGTPVLNDWTVVWANKTLAPTLSVPFNSAKVSSLTPVFDFLSTDPLGSRITYEVEIDTDSNFGSPSICNSDGTCSSSFTNLVTPTDTSPFKSGDLIEFQTPDTLVDGTTYYWRARAYGEGGGTWSFWSEVRSFTVDTSIIYPTWYQTMKGQFNLNTLSGVYPNDADKVTVATTSDKVLLVYGNGTENTPRYRFYQFGTLTNEKEMLSIGSTVLWAKAVASAAYDQFIVGTMGSNRSVKFQVFENGIWSRLITFPQSGPSAQRRSYSVAYESKSGRAIAMSCNGRNADYAIFNGTSWGSVQTLNLGFGTNCEVIKMASNPIKNEIMAVFRDTGPTYRASVWDGSTWVPGSTFNFNTANAGIYEPQHDGVAVEYERNSGRALVVVSRRGTRGFIYRMWNGTAWGTETASSLLGNNAQAQFEWGNLKKDPNSNDLMLCAVSQYSITDDSSFTDLVRWNSGTSLFATNKMGEYYPYSRHSQNFDCEYETKPGRVGKVMAVSDESYDSADGSTTKNRTIWDSLTVSSGIWQSGITDTGRRWDYDGTTYNWNQTETWTDRMDRATLSGDILNIGIARNTLNYVFSVWDGSSWTTPESLAPASVTTKPMGQPFDLVSQEGFNQGVLFSHSIDFGDGKSPAWKEVRFTATKPANTSVLVSVEYFNGTDWSKVPDSQIPGNSAGIAASPISLQNVNSITYNKIRLRADLVCSGFLSCPTLDDWTLEWAQGLTISGIARNIDRTTILTSGVVKVAVNGVEQAGRTGTINASGNWTIGGVKYQVGDTVTLWIDNPGVANRAVSVVKYSGGTSLSNVELSRRWLTVGDKGQAGMTISNEEIKLFDNNNEAGTTRPDLFFNGDASNNLTLCNTGNCNDFSLAVATGTSWRPNADFASITTTHSLVNNGTLSADANTIKVSGNWLNNGSFSAGNSTVLFNATSSTKTINNTGASLYKFNNVTFGEVATPAVWQLITPLYTNGDININYGALSPLTQAITIEKNLSIGTNGLFTKGTATTTFLGAAAANWSDQSTRGQDLGNVLVDGSPKVLSLGSKGMATNVTIGTNDSIVFGVNNLIITGALTNNGSFTADTGTLTASSTGNVRIKTGGYLLNNLTVLNGTVSWVETTATTTGNVSIQGGATTFPTWLYVGGSFTQTGGTFVAAATTTMTATSPGKQISPISNFADIVLSGSGGWVFGTNATTTGSIFLNDGNVTLPSGTLSVARNFKNNGSIINNNNGIVRFRGNPSVATLNGQTLGDIVTTNGCNFSFTELNATTTGSITAEAGSVLNLPTNGSVTVGGSFINNGTMNQNNTALFMNRASGAATFSPAALILSNVTMTGGATYSAVGNIRVSQNFNLGNVGSFTMQSARTLRVDGVFTNGAQNANTTWTGSTLQLTSGATQSINTKSTGGDDYAAITLDNGTQMRMWNSTFTGVTTNAGSSVYGQNWAGVNGALRIYGTYNQNSGTAYWSYGTDFDGTALGTGRQVAVTVNSAAIVNINPNATLEMIGGANASTTLGAISGTFNMNMATSTLRSSYASIRGMTANGINMTGTTTIAQLDNTEFLVDTNNGYAITMAKSVIDQNANKQFANDYFRRGLAATGYSVRVTVASTNYIRFKMHSGNIAGEASDSDVSGNPGEVRWDDSSYVITVSGTVYSDLGTTKIGSPVCDGVTQVLRIQVSGGANYSTSCNAATSAFTFGAVTYTGEPAMSVYLRGSAIAKGVTITRGVTTNLTGIDVYKDRVIVRHEDALAMDTAKLSTFDADNDADMLFTANAGVFNIPASYGMYVWPNKTFTPGGNVTLGSGGPATTGGRFHLGANSIYNAASTDVITVGGDFRLEGGSQFNQATSTVVLNPTDTRTVYAASAITFGNLTLGGTGTTSLQRAIVVNGNLSVNSGLLYSTVSGVTTYGNVTGNGIVNITSAPMRMMKTSSFGGNSAWYLNNLIFGDGSTIATTTKSGSGTTTISGILTVGTNHALDISSKNIVFTGSGDVVVKNGNIIMPNTEVMYAPITTLNVANLPYAKLLFSGNGTSTMPSSKIAVTGDLVVGVSGNTFLKADSQNTQIDVGGNILINTGSSFYAAASAPLGLKGSWTNNGTFVNNGGIIDFTGSGSKTINPGLSSFGTINIGDNLGSWTITDDATTTNLTIGSTTSFTLAPSKTLEVNGNFQNLVGGANTTWTDSTLFLNSGIRNEVNPKDAGYDIYENVKVGAGTMAVFWNSSSTQYLSNPGGGILSQNHAGVNGDLYIFGDYIKSTGTEHWSYLLDFDGQILTADKLRAPKIRFANGATATYVGNTNLQIVGKSYASTTIRALSGNFGLTIAGATSTIRYADFSDMNASGVQFAGTVKVTQMDDVAFSNPAGAGTMMTVANTVINANPLRTTYNNSFNASGGKNVTVTGKPRTAWRIRNHYGTLSGENFDEDPGGDPGYMIWDDSAAMIFISGSVYDSDGVTVSSVCDGIDQSVQLKVEGSGTLSSACDPTDGSYSIGPIVYAPYDTITVYASNGSVAYAYRPMTSVADMDLYKDTVIVRNEQADSITNTNIDTFDGDDDPIIPGSVSGGTLTLKSGTKLIVWDAKSFAPGGNVIVGSNTNSSAIDGDLELRPNAEFISNGSEVYTIGGDFSSGNGAKVTGTGGEFLFTSSVVGKTVAASTPLILTNISFNGPGSWAITGVNAVSGNVKIFNGNVTLPDTQFAVGGDFNNQSTFNANGGTIVFNSTVAGKQIRATNNTFNNIIFDGIGGGWSFIDSATTTGNFTIATGTPTLPSGILSIEGDFENAGGAFNSNNGTLVVRGSGNRKVIPGGSVFGHLRIENGDYVTGVKSATTTGDVTVLSGSLELPEADFAIGGSFRNSGTFAAGATSTVRMISNQFGKVVNPGSSSFNNLVINGTGGFTVEADTIVKNYYTIKTAGAYVQSPTTKITVRDIFTNNVGGTWNGSTLRLERAGTSTINMKTDNGAAYNSIELGPNVQVSSWKSSYANVTADATAYLYSQNDNNTSGALRIYGSYVKTSGTDYWSTTRDFDGSVIPSRTSAVAVRFANGASATYSNGAALETIGEVGKVTTVQAISGNYSLAFNNGSLKSNYLKVRNTDTNGLRIMGSTKLVQFDNVDLATGIDTGKILSIDAAAIDQNTGSVYSNDSFALDSGHTTGINAWLNGSTANSITFTSHSGGLDGESNDSDGVSGCGAIRWDDSSCQFIDQRYYRWRNDDGGEAVPDSEWLGGAASGWPYRQRVHIVNNSTVGNTDVAVKVNLPYQSQMKSDFSDIRFTANDGVTQLPYWVEKFVSAGNATIWVKVPQLNSKSSSDVFAYYGNPGATTLSSSGAFTYLYDANSDLTTFTGDTANFMTSTGPAPIPPLDSVTSPKYLRASDMSGMTTGIMNNSAGVSRGTTIRERIYINGTENDDTCLTFGVSGTNNWGFCVSPNQNTKNVRFVKNAKKDGFAPNGTVITYADIKLTTSGWYSARVDWETSGNLAGTLYDPSGNQLISINTTDAYNPGSGIGFSYWYQHGAWDNVMAYPYMPGDPTVLVFTPQQHGGASWRIGENTPFMTAYQNDVLRLRFGIRNTGTALTDQQFRLDYSVKGTYPNCESVPDGNYSPVKPHTTCGGSDICMATSSRFIDNDATTPLLTTPKGLTFASGRMVESTSNMTAGYNLPGNTYTEVEYAVRFTNSAVQPSYCMRVSNNGTRLVSYTKVAEAAVLQPPKVSNWSFTETPIYLKEGMTKHVVASGTITDLNGISDVVSATGTIFRSGVAGGANCTSNGNNCYSGASTTCQMINCSTFSCILNCSADIQYFAEKTDIGTYAAEDWRAEVTVRDVTALSDVKSVGTELMELKALALDQGNIDYGEIDVGSSTQPTANPKIVLANTGNTGYSLQLEGSDLTAAGSLIPVNKQSFATSTFDIGSCAMSLCKQLASTTPVNFGLTLPKPVSTIQDPEEVRRIFFGITIPFGTKASVHKGLVNLSAN